MVYIEIISSSMFGGKYVLSGNICLEWGNSKKNGEINDEMYLKMLSLVSRLAIWY